MPAILELVAFSGGRHQSRGAYRADTFDLEQRAAAGLGSGDAVDAAVVSLDLLLMQFKHAPLLGQQLLEQRAKPLLVVSQ